jgi:hypothetical protein
MTECPLSVILFLAFLSIDCDNLDDHLANRELHLAALGKSHCPGNTATARRRDFAKEYVNAVLHGAALSPSDIHQPTNAVSGIFTDYGVLPTAKPPLWLKNLYNDMKTMGPAVVAHPAHANIMVALRADPDRRDKALSWPAAIHYVLAQYEYDMLDAACSFGSNAKLIAISDQSDGMYWLRCSFPSDRSCTDVFDEMSQHIRAVTGILDATIREKPIPLPNLPARKTPFFLIKDWPNNASKAQLPELMKLMDRHFTSMSGLSKAYIVERYFHLETDITSKLIMRTVAETKMIYSSCKVIAADGKSADDKPITKPILDLWLDRTDRPVKQSVDFLATQLERDASPEVLSSFNGLLLETTEPMDHAAAYANPGVQLILEHIFNILAAADDASYRYIIGWLASGLQNYRKIGVILCFVGAAGAGKSHLFSETAENLPIMQTIYDGIDGYYMSGQGLDDIVARFNLMSTAKLFAVCEELKPNAAKENMDKLKYQADSTYVTIEAKHADAQRHADRKNVVCLTNHEDALGIDANTGTMSRKFAIFEASDIYSKDHRDHDPALDATAFAFFKAVDDAQRTPATQRAFFWFLKTYDLSEWRAYSFPETPIIARYKAAANPFPDWLEAFIMNGHSGAGTLGGSISAIATNFVSGEVVGPDELHMCFTAWTKAFAPTCKLNLVKFEKAISVHATAHPDVLIKVHVRRMVGGPTLRGYRYRPALAVPAQVAAGFHDQFSPSSSSQASSSNAAEPRMEPSSALSHAAFSPMEPCSSSSSLVAQADAGFHDQVSPDQFSPGLGFELSCEHCNAPLNVIQAKDLTLWTPTGPIATDDCLIDPDAQEDDRGAIWCAHCRRQQNHFRIDNTRLP